jgi:hypothetical protein
MPEQQAPTTPSTPTLPLPQKGGSYERLPDGSLRLIEATDRTPSTDGPAAEPEESPQ